MNHGEQLTIPDLPVRPQREVVWTVMELVEKKRRFWFGKKVMERYVSDEEYPPRAVLRRMPADDINQLEDKDLRAALCLQDAARANGSIWDAPGASHGHSVYVFATDEGVNSKLVRAVYSGIGDSFMNDLRLAEPTRENNSSF